MRRVEDELKRAQLNHRLVTYDELRLDFSPAQIRRRLAGGMLYQVIPRVYCLDQPGNDFLTRATALSLRCPDGFVSGAASSRYWGLRKGIPDLYEFTVPSKGRPIGVEFALLRFADNVAEDDVFLADGGLRVSMPARAVFENAGRLDLFALRSMVQSGIKEGLLDATALNEVGERLCHRGRRGTRLFRLILEAAEHSSPVDSEEELILLDALRGAGMTDATPQQPVRLGSGFTVHLDIGIPSARLGAEVDGPSHNHPIAVHRDKSRDFHVAVQGWQVVRVPAEEVRRGLRPITAKLMEIARQRSVLLQPGEA